MNFKNLNIPIFAGLAFLFSCASYQQGIMLKTETSNFVSAENNQPENYIIQPNDRLEIELYNYGGEALIDPYFNPNSEGISNNNLLNNRRVLQYLVNSDGTVILPKIGEQNLKGKTLKEAEKYVTELYNQYYSESYVQIRYTNKRVVVNGPTGGQVIQLSNENTKLSEVLASMGSLNSEVKIQNIRILRGEKLFTADFSTPENFIQSDIILENGDIIYVEPVIRPFLQSVRDYGSLLNIASGILSLAAIIITLNSTQ